MPVEEQHFIHNMSAPPRSKIAIGSHRKGREIVSVQLDRLPDEQENWDRVLALQYGYNSPDAFIQAAEQHLRTLSPPAVAVISKGAKATCIIHDPLLAVAILPRCAGHLFLYKNPIVLQQQLLNKSICFSGTFAKLLLQGASS